MIIASKFELIENNYVTVKKKVLNSIYDFYEFPFVESKILIYCRSKFNSLC